MQTGNMGTEGAEMMDFTNTTSNPEGDELKQELRTYFSHTFSRCFQGERWWKKIPLKMIVHLISLTIITAQLVLFANERSHFATYLNRNNIALKHLLLRNWSKDYETMPYPPTTGTYAVYTIDELKEHVQFVVEGIHSLPTTAVGSFFLNNDNVTNPLRICATYYKSGIFNRTSQHSAITIDRNKRKQCKDVGINTTNYGLDPSLDDLIKSENGVLVRLLELTLDFNIASIHVDMRRQERLTECFEIIGSVIFDNYDIQGQIPVILTTSIKGFECKGDSINKSTDPLNVLLVSMVFLVNIASLVASVVSFRTSLVLFQKVRKYFKKKTNNVLSKRGSWEILRLSDIMIIISCLSTIIGTCLKLRYDVGELSTSEDLDMCAILLGIGCMLLWILALHYLAFEKVFSLLFLVLDRSALPVLRFLLCIFVVYMGFVLCGWAVLGPYNVKFLSFTATFQCLLALMNGDEVYVTMAAADGGSQLAYWFNSIFVTLFLFLFAILALNMFIAIYNTTYEKIREDKEEEKSDLMTFIGGSTAALYTLDLNECCTDNSTGCSGILCCKPNA